jgi:hypothetical protein
MLSSSSYLNQYEMTNRIIAQGRSSSANLFCGGGKGLSTRCILLLLVMLVMLVMLVTLEGKCAEQIFSRLRFYVIG